MLKFDLALFSDRQEYELEIKKTDPIFHKDFKIAEDFLINLALTKDKDSTVIVEGTLSGAIFLECGRCLKQYTHELELNFVTIFKDKAVYTKEDELSEVEVFKGNELDLYEYLRETIILDMPLKPVCTEDCKGICSICGKDRNVEKCGCETKGNDSPFVDLKNIIK